MARDWICPACGTRDPYTYPHHIVCRLCAHVAPRDAEPERSDQLVGLEGLEPAAFRRWGNAAVLEGYREPGGAVFLPLRELEKAGYIHDPALELVFHSEGYVVARPAEAPELFQVADGAGILPYDDTRVAEQVLVVLAALERALELLEGERVEAPRTAEIEHLRRVVKEAHGPA
jgi:hypothetical protein